MSSNYEQYVRKMAGMNTYDEVIAKAGDDPDKERNLHEDFMTGLEDDWSFMVTEAREALKQPAKGVTYEEVCAGIDFGLLRAQRLAILTHLQDFVGSHEEREALEGVTALLEALSDAAVDTYGVPADEALLTEGEGA